MAWRIRLVAKDTALSRRRSRVRTPYALPIPLKIETLRLGIVCTSPWSAAWPDREDGGGDPSTGQSPFP